MTVPQESTSSFARVSLTRGTSPSEAWEVNAETAGARIDIGSSNRCAWQVQGVGVAPHHVEMYWDGEVLWVADLQGAGGVKVDGLAVDDWYAMGQGSTIEFGAAAMRVETGARPLEVSGIASRGQDETDELSIAATELARPGMTPAPPPPAALPEAKTQMLEPRPPVRRPSASVPPPPSRRPTSAPPPPPRQPARLPQPPSRAAPPRSASAPMSHPPLPPPSAPSPLPPLPPPHAGGTGLPPAVAHTSPSPPASPNVILDDGLAPLPGPLASSAPGGPIFGGAAAPHPRADANATRLVPAPAEPEAIVPMSIAAAATGRPPPPRIGTKGSVARASDPGRPIAGITPVIAATPQPAPAQALPAVAAAGPEVGITTSSGARFAAAPPTGGKATTAGGKQALPLRTWLLLGTTLVAAVVFLFGGDDEELAQPAAAPSTEEPSGAGDASTAEPEAEAPLNVVHGPTATEEDAGPEEPSPEAAEGEPATVEAAVEALMSNRQREALRLYRALAESSPEEPAYGAIVQILERRVQGRCRDGVDPDGEPCD